MAKAHVTGPARRVTCINKTNREDPTQRITHVGDESSILGGWRMTLDEAIAFIDRGGTLYVQEDGKPVEVFPRQGPSGKRYLTTTRDDTRENNLLRLPECKILS
jgi:hypothetical protein